jgi:serine/threonine-protein kinase
VRGLLSLVLLLAAMGLVYAGSAYLTLWLGVRAEVVTVPELVGLTLEEAERLASSSGLRLQRIDGRHDGRIGQGRVLVQEPPSGSSTKAGRTVRVAESLGPAVARLPDLSGGSLRRAEIALSARGLRVSTRARVPTEGIPHGQVILQDPPAGSEQWPGGGVSLLLSAGPPARSYVMPDLVGWSRERVARWAARHGLRLGRVSAEERPGEIPGAVVSQRPPAGYPLNATLPVAITVAGGESKE